MELSASNSIKALMYNSHILSGDKTSKVNYGPQHLAPTTRAIAMLSGAPKDRFFQGFLTGQYFFPPQGSLCVVRKLGRGKRKRAKDDGKGEERKRGSRLFPLLIVHCVLTFF